MFKCGIVVGGLAAATLLGTFAAGPALASTGSPHRVPVVISEAAPTVTPSDPGSPGGLPLPGALGQQASTLPSALAPSETGNGSGIVPGVNSAVGSLLSKLGLTDLAALVSGTSATQNAGGLPGGLGGLLSNLNGSNGLPDLGKLLGGLSGSNGLPDLSKLLNGQNGQPDLSKLVGLLVIGKILGGLGGSNPLANPLSGQNGLPDLGLLGSLGGSNGLSNLLTGSNGQPDLGKLLGGLDIGKMLGGRGGSNPLGNVLSGSNDPNAPSALGNLINGAKPPVGG